MDLKIRNKPVWMTVILLLISFILLLRATMMVSPGSDFAALGNNLCPLDWTAEINIVDNGTGMNVLTIGQGVNTTDDLNPDCNEARLPPLPPTGVFDVRLILPKGSDASLTDIRSSLYSNLEWKLEFQPGSGGYPFTFTWDSTALPTGTWGLQDSFGGNAININMTNQDSYVLENEDFDSLKIKYTSPIQLTRIFLPLNMKPGN